LNYVDLSLDETGINHWTFYGKLVSNDTLTAHNKYVSSADNTYIVSFNTLTGNVIDTVPSLVPPYPDDREGAFYRYGVHVPYGGAGIWMFDYPDHKIAYIVPGSPSLWTYDGQRYLKEAFIDTVYTVNSNHLTPHIALDLGKFHWSYDRRMDKDSSISKISIDYILENDNLIYFHFHTGLYENRDNIRTYCGFYDKRTGATKVMDGDAIIDDLSGIMPLTIRRVSSDGEFVGLVQVADLLDWKEQHPSSAINNPVLRSLIRENLEDNPVVFIALPTAAVPALLP